jgi:hypothetical protein
MMDQEKITSADDFASTPQGLAQRWQTEIDASRQELSKFHDDSDKILTRYLDKRDDWGKDQSKVNLFWSTMKVLLSMLYARPPKADVSRSFQDADDDQARVAGTMLQRILNRAFDDNVSAWDSAVRTGIEDWLVVGLGQMWLRYEVETEPVTIPAVFDELGNEISPAVESEQIVEEDAPVDYIHWKDFFWSPARTWEEVRWVARRVYMTKDQLKERFGEEIANVVPMSRQNKQTGNTNQAPQYDPWAKAEIFEIWCKENKKVYWYAKGTDVILDVKDDPLDLDGFFPCPKPLAANVTSSNFMPRADYVFAQDQFSELDEINTRITWLTRAAKVAGVYDKSAGDSVGRMFQQAQENQLIPVDNWAMFAEGGGVKGKVDFAPIDQVVNCIERLRQYRQDKVMQIYEVLGISDIMRGSSKASETAAAQQIKAQFGSTRIQLSQFYIAEWISQGLRIKAEIICKHWQPETIIKRSNIMRTPDAPLAMQAVQLLKDEEMAEYRINVEADSMAALDWASERDAAVQFMQGLGAFISQVTPLAQATPAAGPYLMKLLQWSVSKFRVSTEIESVLDQAIAGMQQSAQQQMAPPDPTKDPKFMLEMEKIQSNERIAMVESQTDKQIASLKASVELQKIEMKAALDGVAQQYQQIMQAMNTTGQVAPQLAQIADQVAQLAQGSSTANQEALSQMQAMMARAMRPKKRVPVRDDNGDIIEVKEVDDDAIEPMAMGQADLPPVTGPQMPMGGMNG